MKLNLGCGADFRPGWLNVDCRPLYPEGPEFICSDLRRLDQRIPDESTEEIAAQHVLEFLPWRELDPVICLLARKLKTAGVLFVQVPSVEAVIGDYQTGKTTFNLLQRRLYGDQAYPQEAQGNAWNEAVLRARLAMAGLRVQHLEKEGGCLKAWGAREES